MRLRLIPLLMALSGCTATVGPTPATTMYGDAAKAPKIAIKKSSPLWGAFGSMSAEAGGNFAGHAILRFKKETGEYFVDANVANDPSPVIDANGRLITAMDPSRLAEIATLTERQKIISEANRDVWIAGFNMVKDVGTAAVGAFLAKAAPAFPATGGLPPGIDLSAILASMGNGKPFTLPTADPH